MSWAIRSAASGMSMQQLAMDVVANNISNIATPGFKSSNARFTDLLYGRVKAPEGALMIGSGTRMCEVNRDFSMGILENDGVALHLAIEGEGFFQVRLPGGGIAYTRAGVLSVDSSGNLTINGGYLLEPPISIPAEFSMSTINVASDGVVTLSDHQGTEWEAGHIILAKFVNPNGLEAKGGGIFFYTEASGMPTTAMPGVNGMGLLRQGCIEKSNTDLAREMVEMITALRAYQLNAKVVQVSDEAMGIANNIIRG